MQKEKPKASTESEAIWNYWTPFADKMNAAMYRDFKQDIKGLSMAIWYHGGKKEQTLISPWSPCNNP